MAQRFMRFKDGKQKALTLSYDDGVYQDKRFIEIIDKYSLKATFNINAGILEDEENPEKKGKGPIRHRLGKTEVYNLYSGTHHEVAIHGLTHQFMNEIPTSQAVIEIINDRLALENLFGKRIVGGAYPFGTPSMTDDVVEILRLCGIKYCRATGATHSFAIPEDWLRLKPTCHHNDPCLMQLADEFLNNGYFAKPKLFYLWGHTYEFDSNNNWNVIEEFAEKVSGKDDVWYATNIEIYEYVEAYKRLEYFADGKTVYNPTLIDVWMYDNGETYKIPSGETVKIG